MTTTAKLFKQGRSHAVKLPREFRLPGTKVRVSRVGKGVLLEPIEPEIDIDAWFAKLDAHRAAAGEFMPEGRQQPPMPPPTDIFENAPIGFSSAEQLRRAGFQGFLSVAALRASSDLDQVPNVRGVYIVSMPDGLAPRFLRAGSGGRFKGRDPNVAVAELKAKWVEGAGVIYIGKAGGKGRRATLRRRLRQYLDFRRREPVGHWGGRYTWQLSEPERLVICWRAEQEPGKVEQELIRAFRSQCGARPFANLKD